MNSEIREDIRPLCEFYPEAEIRQQIHYAFAHQFLPGYVRQNPRAFLGYLYTCDMNPTRFIQSRWDMMVNRLEEAADLAKSSHRGARGFRRVSDLDLWTQEVDGQPGAFVELPVPERTPLAFFVGVVLLAPIAEKESWPDDADARYFTLERNDEISDGYGVLCEWTDTGHRNFAVLVGTNRDDFVAAVSAALRE